MGLLGDRGVGRACSTGRATGARIAAMTVVTAAMTEVTAAMTEVMTEVTGARTAATVAPDPGCSASPTAPVEHPPSPPRVFEARKCSQREPAIRPCAQAATAERKCSRKLVRALPLAMHLDTRASCAAVAGRAAPFACLHKSR